MKYDPLVIEIVNTKELVIINPNLVAQIERKKGSCIVTMQDESSYHVNETMNKLCRRIDLHCGSNWSE